MLNAKEELMNRREFISASSAFAAMAPNALMSTTKPVADASLGEAKLIVGIISDPHLSLPLQKEKGVLFKKTLQRFDEAKVDAILMPGDIFHGRLCWLERFAEAYFEVFPGDKGSDGRRVERMIVTGNHDIDEWWYGLKKNETLEECEARYRDAMFFFHREEAWKRVWGEPYEPYFLREVKGYKFLLRHWPSSGKGKWKEPHRVDEAFAKYGPMLAKEKVFFYCQHEQPSASVNANWLLSEDCERFGNADACAGPFLRELLNGYPNCVSLTGHSHCGLADERSIWQDKFTAVNCGNFSGYPFNAPGRENGHDHDKNPNPVREMEMFDIGSVHDAMIMTVYENAIRFRRLDCAHWIPSGPDWIVPIGSSERPYAFQPRQKSSLPPVFPAKAKVLVREIAMGQNRSGEKHPQLEVSFPTIAASKSGDRAYEFSVRMEMRIADTIRTIDEKRVFSPGFLRPERFDKGPATCLFARSEVPVGRSIRFVVTPYNVWLKPGEPIASPFAKYKNV